MNQNILLVEPAYKSKFPPIGLMKISQFHKSKGDYVEFIKGISPEVRDKFEWDRVYISTLFTYNWDETLKTIKYYRYSAKEPVSDNLYVGGVLATLMSEDLSKRVNCKIIKGLLNEKGKLGYEDDDIIDSLTPDYNILSQVDYKYPQTNSYFVHATRGCVRKCAFCAVPVIEPHFLHYVSIEKQVEEARELYGDKKDLIIMDNNILASQEFKRIIYDIKRLGFYKDSTISYDGKNGQKVKARRSVDFNQGVDVRLLDDTKMALISEVAIKPLRIAFDSMDLKDVYVDKIKLAAMYGINNLSNYILFNYKDTPEDFYNRLKINVELNEQLGLQIYSFPMRYIDINSKDRSADSVNNMGVHWNRKYLRGIQCILLSSRGVVGPKKDFFEAAFGSNLKEFEKILLMPEDYIINREFREKEGLVSKWWIDFMSLKEGERDEVLNIVKRNNFNEVFRFNVPSRYKNFLEHYLTAKSEECIYNK